MVGVVCAGAAAIAYGLATVLQAVGARRAAPAAGLDPRLLWRLARSVPYASGLVLDGAGFGLAVVALHRSPVYLVQSVVASNLAVTAVLAAVLLRATLRPAEWAALAAVAVGLVLVGASATSGTARPVPDGGRWVLLAAAIGLGAAAAVVAARPAGGGAGLGVVAGLEFGVVALTARVVPGPLAPDRLVVDPAVWALVVAGLAGLVAYPVALQRGRVTATAAAVVAAETLPPALVAVTLLGDRSRPGWVPAAIAGTVLVVAGALALTRREAVPEVQARDASGTVR